MASLNDGKDVICRWIREHFDRSSSILDVGACDGKWRKLLPEYPNMDANEAWWNNCRQIATLYRFVYPGEIIDFRYEWYDLILFGDVLEHMNVEVAQWVLQYAAPRCRDLIVCVPWLWPQDAYNGNPYERHIQDDLTPELFAQRYPELEVLHNPGGRICYYHKKPEE